MPAYRRESLGFLLSGLTLLFFIIAIIVFINYGARIGFYIVVVITFIIGILNVRVISKIPRPAVRYTNTQTRRPSGRKRRR